MSIYLDASVLIAIFGDETHTSAAVSLVAETSERLVVSDFARGEVTSVISKNVRSNKLDEVSGRLQLDAIEEWIATAAEPIATEASDIRLAVQIVRNFGFGLRFPDAVHLAAARARGLRLATFDERMRMVAGLLRIDQAFG